ncbi:MAG: ribulose-phosphate 3-epimerase [Kiritimatiellae bacterium]|nr:ribulose-phosphate 3-epimerase [Kiritimatiellia bacterium]MBR4476319.1 ribulose-phosphate 3-epimerase [Kiritimatiellia bacterium]
MKLEILPSLLAADFGRLSDEILRAEASGADALHLDIMDPHFVPNLSFGPDVVALSRRTAPGFYRNVHLMMSRPDLYLEKFAAAGAQTIQIHVEADCDLHVELARIRSLGVKPAIVLNPETPVERIAPYLDEVDEVLVMTVHPGYGGQKFIADCLPKVSWVRERRPGLDIMVDGGVNGDTAVESVKAGANQLVAGSYLFRQSDMAAAVADMRRRCAC